MIVERNQIEDEQLAKLFLYEIEWLNILQHALAIRRETKHGNARVKNACQTLRVIRKNILQRLGS